MTDDLTGRENLGIEIHMQGESHVQMRTAIYKPTKQVLEQILLS